jgi:hypothetical protein
MHEIQSPAMGKQAQTTVRYPEEWLPRIDAVAKAMSRPGIDVNRTDALRYLLAKGLDVAESELGIKSKSKASK